MKNPFSVSCRLLTAFAFALAVNRASAVLVAYDGFDTYAVGQVENASGVGLNGGSGWGGAYDVNDTQRSGATIGDRTSTPVTYSSGAISLNGGTRAFVTVNQANATPLLSRPLATSLLAANGPFYFSFLYRSNQGGTLTNQDFLQIGLAAAAGGTSGSPDTSTGVNTINGAAGGDQEFFARSGAGSAPPGSSFDPTTLTIGTTYLIVAKVSATTGGNFDRLDLFVNPTTLTEPLVTSATGIADSGVNALGNLVIRTVGLDSGDTYVIDEFRIGTDYASVVPEPGSVALLIGGICTLGLLRRRRASVRA